jgi:predicted RNA-binding protein with RPS1 domain
MEYSNIIADPNESNVFKTSNKYNDTLELSEEDKNSNKIKILCSEPYAQEFYDAVNNHYENSGLDLTQGKDLNIGQICNVKAVRVAFADKVIYVKDINSEVEISVPFKEFSKSVDELIDGSTKNFNVCIQKADLYGGYVGSEKKCLHLNYKQELFNSFEGNRWFEVTIKKLIKGGYLASYKDTVDCFIPGSHAGANVIRDFSRLLGKTLNVMVDNYDKSNDLFILSYKQYIKKSMSTRISDIDFGKKYTGILTNKPYDFGVFVEFEDYFTGLIHSSEFKDYLNARKNLKAEDAVDFYVKNVTNKGKEYRVVLTLDSDNIDPVRRQWSDLRNKIEGHRLEYEIDYEENKVMIKVDDLEMPVAMKKRDMEKNLEEFPKVFITKVDPINKRLKFEFVRDI